MKTTTILAALLALLVGCSTPPSYDGVKRKASKQIDIFRDGSKPTRPCKEIGLFVQDATLQGQPEIELEMIQKAKKMGANALVLDVPQRNGMFYGPFRAQAVPTYLFRGHAVVYTGEAEDTTGAKEILKDVDLGKARSDAEGGDPIAQFNLGVAYRFGVGVPQDDHEAVKWFQKSAYQGNPLGQGALGTMYDEGRGVPKDTAKAVEFFVRSARQGHAGAQGCLGLKYAEGKGVSQDYVQAYKWWSLAAAAGDTNALANRDLVSKRMTPGQIAEGQKLASEFVPRTPAR